MDEGCSYLDLECPTGHAFFSGRGAAVTLLALVGGLSYWYERAFTGNPSMPVSFGPMTAGEGGNPVDFFGVNDVISNATHHDVVLTAVWVYFYDAKNELLFGQPMSPASGIRRGQSSLTVPMPRWGLTMPAGVGQHFFFLVDSEKVPRGTSVSPRRNLRSDK